MPVIEPFKGLIYNKEKIGDIASCVCPPYDIISDPQVYYARSPYNAVRLELPVDQPPLTGYEAAKQTLDRWLQENVLLFDREDTIYIYEQEFQVDGIPHTRRGFIPLVKLDRQHILTHEETRQKAKEDRERLISTLKIFTSLVFALYEDREGAVESVLAGSDREKIYDFTDELSIRNRFYRMKSRNEMDRLSTLLAEKSIYIADGHHRLSVSFKLGLSYLATYLTDMHSDGIVILPYHRIVTLRQKKSLREILERVRTRFEVERIAYTDGAALKSASKGIIASLRPAFLLYGKDDTAHVYVLTEKEPFYAAEGMHESLKGLRVAIAHAGLLRQLVGVKEEEIFFAQDAHDAMDLVRQGGSDLALLVPPTTVEEVKAVAQNSLYMPPKSTYFYPKILTGLAFQKYA